MSGTVLGDSTTQVNLASYGTGNPFSVGVGVSIVTTGIGIYGDAAYSWTLTNAGTVGGADSLSTAAGNAGVFFKAGGDDGNRLTNTGTIFGGKGGDNQDADPGRGGDGVFLGGRGTIVNSGMMAGGVGGGTGAPGGGSFAGYAAAGGSGLHIDNGYSNIRNLAGGTMRGAAGGAAELSDAIGGRGGYGILLSGGSNSVTNSGTIQGGDGGAAGSASYGGKGGSGLIFGPSFGGESTVINHGLIAGGTGAYSALRGGYGGAGVTGSTIAVWNSGTIQGGGGGGSTTGGQARSAAYGVFLRSGELVNQSGGTIIGGTGGDGQSGGAGGLAVSVSHAYASGAAKVLNAGTIRGGAGGTGLPGLSGSGGAGSVGVGLTGDTVFRNFGGGHITGGAGGDGALSGGGGGTGIFSSGTFTNAGTVAGGTGGSGGTNGSYGGIGALAIGTDGVFKNLSGGSIVGGAGGYGQTKGGVGGKGVFLSDGTFRNLAGASIAGGKGGDSANTGGAGGVGVYMRGTMTNAGTITGGAGGMISVGKDAGYGAGAPGTAGQGGVGVNATTGASTITNRGTISGGSGAAAVQFGSYDDTLIVDPGAVFNGVVDGAGGANTLVMAGNTGTGTISGIGTNFTNFQTINERGDASWKLTGANSFASGGVLSVGGALEVTADTVFDGTVRGFGTLTVSGAITIGADAKFTVYDLLLTGTGTATLNRNLSYAGNLTQEAGTVFTIADGKLLATSCMVDGAGTIELGAGSTFLAKACVGQDETVSFTGAKGWLGIDFPTDFDGSIKGFATGDKIDLSSTDFAFGGDETVTFQENDGGTAGMLTVTSGADVFSVQLFGQYVAAGFHLGADKHGGTLITYRPAATASTIHDLAPGGSG